MSHALKGWLAPLTTATENLSIEETLFILAGYFHGAVTFSSSFSNEDQVITDLIAGNDINISIFTLDTGRLFHQTYDVWNSTVRRYRKQISAYYPDARAIEQFVQDKGPNPFYDSLEDRKDCCFLRKVVPLKRALKGNDIWITGLRAEHSPERENLTQLEWDEENKVIKYHPLLHWTTEQVATYIQEHHVPYNKLADEGFVSIGCQPCTRAIKPGEAFRAGRWWWEEASKKECGLHVHR